IETPLNSINEAVLPFASKTSDDVSLTEHLISRSIKFYLIFSVALAVVLLVLAPVVINLFFPLFSSGLELVPLFALYYALSFDFPMGTFFRVINKPRVLTITYISSAVVSLVPGYFLISHFLIQGLLATMVIARILGIMISIFFIRKSRYRIEFIPRNEDLAFFWLLFSRFFWQILRRFSRK
ncbi:hypothetical protein KKE06_02040, partial [Candidatus Micrarchaeota archaeon]|nr:hypothetical protein [Candidatus Micrarchaeota archaeon]